MLKFLNNIQSITIIFFIFFVLTQNFTFHNYNSVKRSERIQHHYLKSQQNRYMYNTYYIFIPVVLLGASDRQIIILLCVFDVSLANNLFLCLRLKINFSAFLFPLKIKQTSFFKVYSIKTLSVIFNLNLIIFSYVTNLNLYLCVLFKYSRYKFIK